MKGKEQTVSIHNLTIGYKLKKGVKVVGQTINADLYSGELTCLLGANGAGKSTLLRTLSAFLPPVSGDIIISGRSINSYSNCELAMTIGVVLTEKCEVQNLTVEELVAMGRSPYTGFWGTLDTADKEQVQEAMKQVDILHLKTRMIQTLSDGERQKVMIAKALAQQTPIIFLDEPTAFLDFPSKVEMMQLLHELSHRMNKTIFLSTHDLELALQLADKLWLMDRKKELILGTPEDLSLNDSLGSFFTRKGICFEKESGLFRIETDFFAQVRLEGSGQTASMVAKALRRNGIWAHQDAPAGICIFASDEKAPVITLVDGDSEPFLFTSVASLIEDIVLRLTPYTTSGF